LDLFEYYAIFNTLRAKTIYRTIDSVKVIVPDSCGIGYLNLFLYDSTFYSTTQLGQYYYSLPAYGSYKYPKKIIVEAGTSKQDYNVEFLNDNLMLYESVGYWGADFYTMKFTHDQVDRISKVEYYRSGNFQSVDTFVYSDDNKYIYQRSYYQPQILPMYYTGVLTYYFKDSKLYSYGNSTYSFNDSVVTITDEKGYKKVLLFDTKNKKQPMQSKYFMEIQFPKNFYLTYQYYPGNVRKWYSYMPDGTLQLGGSEIELFYDNEGNLVKENYYYMENPFRFNKRKYLYSVYTEY